MAALMGKLAVAIVPVYREKVSLRLSLTSVLFDIEMDVTWEMNE